MAEHLTAQELALRWKKEPEWVTDQARRGNIPGAWKLGRLWRFDKEQIKAYEQGQRTDNIFALTPRAQKNLRKKTA